MTAPDDEALTHDITAMKNAGFNMLRKHIKIESARWYYHCDRLGMLVWQDAVSGGGTDGEYNAWTTNRKPTLIRSTWNKFRDDTAKHFTALGADDPIYRRDWSRTCDAMVHMLGGHPSIVTWVLFNEGWGQFDACDAAERIHALDPTRPIDATSAGTTSVAATSIACTTISGRWRSTRTRVRCADTWPNSRRSTAVAAGPRITWCCRSHDTAYARS